MAVIKVNHEFKFTNDYVFAEVMKDPELCRQLLQRIFPDREIEAIRFCKPQERDKHSDEPPPEPEDDEAASFEISLTSYDSETTVGSCTAETQKTMSFGPKTKSIRLDVLFKGDSTWYNVEIQCENRYNIPRRSRYYSSLCDIDQLGKGEDYNILKDTYVIFICTFDLFGLNEPIYSFENYDVKNDLRLNDGSYTIIVNTKSTKDDLPRELKCLFDYINNEEVETDDSFIADLDHRVGLLNTDDNVWRREIMRLDQEIKYREARAREDGHAAGLSEGHAAGLSEGRDSKAKEIAANLKAAGMDDKDIAINTGLSEKEIKKL